MKLNKTQSMMLGIAIGDAFGLGYEFINGGREEVARQFDFTKYRTNPNEGWGHSTPGLYSDDTQMSIAIAELLISKKTFSKENLADKFVECYKRDPINGYARRFQDFLNEVKSGKEFLEKINPVSKRNGAAMRSVPIGIVKNLEELLKYAKINAEVTHNTPEGISSAVITALASHKYYHGIGNSNQENIFDFVIENGKGYLDANTIYYLRQIKEMNELNPEILFGKKDKELGVPCDGAKTVGAVLYLLNKHTSSKEILKEAVLLGGDTDSTASIALGINAIKYGLEDLPEFLMSDLTNHKYGREYLIELGNKLEHK